MNHLYNIKERHLSQLGSFNCFPNDVTFFIDRQKKREMAAYEAAERVDLYNVKSYIIIGWITWFRKKYTIKGTCEM